MSRSRQLFASIVVLLAAACSGPDETTATTAGRPAQSGDPQRGIAAIRKYGCGGCHTIPGIPDATGRMGPSLAGVADRMAARQAPNQPDHLILWISDPQRIAPGTAMPDLNVSDSEAADIAAYLSSR